MKTSLSSLLALALLTSYAFAGNWFGPGPWANGTFYPGNLDGKYMATVSGNNINGVLGFAIVDGAPPFRVSEQQQADINVVAVNDQIGIDPLQNYFVIFVEGRTYSGLTTAGINIDTKTVSGALQGTDPIGVLPVGTGDENAASIEFTARDALTIVNRGLSGGFSANITQDRSVFTFQGRGQLNTPANPQTNIISAVPTEGFGPLIPPNTITNEVITGQILTASTPFNLSGIRTSFTANNPAAVRDTLDAQGGGGGGN